MNAVVKKIWWDSADIFSHSVAMGGYGKFQVYVSIAKTIQRPPVAQNWILGPCKDVLSYIYLNAMTWMQK